MADRSGRVREFKRGCYYLTITDWEDGHREIELHKCVPQLLYYTADPKQLDVIKKMFDALPIEIDKLLMLPEEP